MARPNQPIGNGILAFHSALAEDERERITGHANDGRVAAKTRGVKFGPKPKLTEHQKIWYDKAWQMATAAVGMPRILA